MNLNIYVVIVIIRLDSKLTLPSTILVWSMFAPKLRVIRGSTGMIRIKFLMLLIDCFDNDCDGEDVDDDFDDSDLGDFDSDNDFEDGDADDLMTMMIILMTLKVTAVDLMVTCNRAEKNPSSLFQTKREILQQYVWLVCFAAQCASHKTNISQETRNNGGTWHQSGTPGAKGGFWKRQIF